MKRGQKKKKKLKMFNFILISFFLNYSRTLIPIDHYLNYIVGSKVNTPYASKILTATSEGW